MELGRPERSPDCAWLRSAFEKRTGSFKGEDPWFDARTRAFLDDALTDAAVLADVGKKLPAAAGPALKALGRAHRGFFVVKDEGDPLVVSDVWSGARFYVDDAEQGLLLSLRNAKNLFDGRLAADPESGRIAMLPGALFHPESATEPALEVVAEARARGMSTKDALDALLRMEHAFCNLSRVKPSYAYRKEALVVRAMTETPLPRPRHG